MKGCNDKYDHEKYTMQTCYDYNNRIHRHTYIHILLMSILNKHNHIFMTDPTLKLETVDVNLQIRS